MPDDVTCVCLAPDLDPRWPRLLAAARAWKANLIPNTSTGVAGPTNSLIAAIEAFDEEPPDITVG